MPETFSSTGPSTADTSTNISDRRTVTLKERPMHALGVLYSTKPQQSDDGNTQRLVVSMDKQIADSDAMTAADLRDFCRHVYRTVLTFRNTTTVTKKDRHWITQSMEIPFGAALQEALTAWAAGITINTAKKSDQTFSIRPDYVSEIMKNALTVPSKRVAVLTISDNEVTAKLGRPVQSESEDEHGWDLEEQVPSKSAHWGEQEELALLSAQQDQETVAPVNFFQPSLSLGDPTEAATRRALSQWNGNPLP